MRRLVVVLAVLCATLAGPASAFATSNDDVIAQQKAGEARAQAIHRKLIRVLHLRTYAGAGGSFTIGNDKWCSIDVVAAGADADAYKGSGWVLTSPDQDAIVKVSHFVGTPESACLVRVKRALHW